MILVGRALNRLRRWLGFPEWSLSAYVKHRVKNIIKFVTDYEHALMREAGRRGADGVVCGHIHKAEIKEVDNLTYYNTGDWVESCTAVIEHFDGTMALVKWAGTAPAPVTA